MTHCVVLFLCIDRETFADGAGVFFILAEDNISGEISSEHFSRDASFTLECYGREMLLECGLMNTAADIGEF